MLRFMTVLVSKFLKLAMAASRQSDAMSAHE